MDLYKTLGVDRGSAQGDIKKAYLRLAKTEHPDKGGNEEKFKTIVKAYEVLSDEEKRRFYDQTGQIPGEEAPQQGPPGGMPFPFGGMGGFTMNMGDLFGMFGGQRQRQRQGKEPPKVVKIPVSLAQFYNGHAFGVSFERHKFCSDCKGSGAERVEECGVCRGSGVQTRMIQMGPGMMMQSQGPCSGCEGKGKKHVGKCGKCKGAMRFAEEKKIHVQIQPGMAAGEVLIFPGICSDSHDFSEPGDVHIILENADDSHGWVRSGADLEKTIVLNYTDSITGTTVKLDGHPHYPGGVYVDIPGAVTNGDVLVVEKEGMPLKGTKQLGNMKLQIRVAVKKEERDAVRGAAGLQEIAAALQQFAQSKPRDQPLLTAK